MGVIGAVGAVGALCGCFHVQLPVRVKEAVLRSNLHTLRDTLHQYCGDLRECPSELEDLVKHGYLKKVPIDPFTHRDDTWVPVFRSGTTGHEIADVHPCETSKSLDGSRYSDW